MESETMSQASSSSRPLRRGIPRKSVSLPLPKKKSLHFGEVHITEFPITIGDNPFVSEGCPVALDAKAVHSEVLDFAVYERYRPERRSKDKFRLGVTKRCKLLMSNGYDLPEIAQASMDASAIKQQRIETNKNYRWDGVNALVEKSQRRFQKIMTLNVKGPDTQAATSA
jgi:hypothetical protein